MAILILICFLVAAVAEITALVKVLRGRVSKWLGFTYMSLVVAAGCIAAYTTFYIVYYANSNTRIHGWPIPTVIFQRDDAESPWLDFVGPTTILAYPMNIILFLIGPSILLLIWACWKPLPIKTKEQNKSEEATPNQPPV